ncbi:thioesterase domain-containing protein [Aquibacillus sp. 3ASR75-11]|uniref:Thioesterase domain-containing protein n=1 Tax=Terrihalobacillus insolitus TaxID=2950438 RepID=A0A9X4AMY5_9BACI|nr:thioesterase domain-containing protein [Terrihalobacillus insolitus]MDC3412619.1 thioesterase domain-containing protein [Terrihalobacillus insolitus]MDC3423970.1 thioesterase domain-containing protein [Terrihalobacillus insolitus]
MYKPTSSKWFGNYKNQYHGKLKLFCFPYAGAGASIFRNWPNQLSDVDVIPIQLPGRENRYNEPPELDMHNLAKKIGICIKPYLEEPFVFFGHSMGALISFELTRFIRREFNILPRLLIISACRAPQCKKSEPLSCLPTKDFLKKVEDLNGTSNQILNNPDLIQLIEPILRKDFYLCETYKYQKESPLECPITVYGGAHDSVSSEEELSLWSKHTSNTFEKKIFPGGHFYFLDNICFMKILNERLDGLVKL